MNPPGNTTPENFHARALPSENMKELAEMRSVLPGLHQTWEIFHHSPTSVQALQKLHKAHFPQTQLPGQIDGHETRDKSITAFTHGTGTMMRTVMRNGVEVQEPLSFEVLLAHNRALNERQRLRQTIENSAPNQPNRTPEQLQLRQAEERVSLELEVRDTTTDRMIRRTLRTLDLYAELNKKFSKYTNIENAGKKQAVTAGLEALMIAMVERLSAQGNHWLAFAADQKVHDALVTLPGLAEDLYLTQLNTLVARNRAIYVAIPPPPEAERKQLEQELWEIQRYVASYHYYVGEHVIEDLRILLFPESNRKYVESNQPAEKGKLDEVARKAQMQSNEKVINTRVTSIIDGLRGHVNRVIGTGQPVAPGGDVPLLDTDFSQGTDEQKWQKRRAWVNGLASDLAYLRGAIRSGVGQGVRTIVSIPARIVPFGQNAVDAALPEPRSAEQYRRDMMRNSTEALGLPENFDFSEKAWKELYDNPDKTALEKHQKKLESVIEQINKQKDNIEKKGKDFVENLDTLDALRAKVPYNELREAIANPNLAILNATTRLTKDSDSIKDLLRRETPLTLENRQKLAAAYLVLHVQMKNDWKAFSGALNGLSVSILQNVEGHAKAANAAEDDAAGAGDDAWIYRLVFAGALFLGVNAAGANGGLRSLPGWKGSVFGLRFDRIPLSGRVGTVAEHLVGRPVNAVTSIPHRLWVLAFGPDRMRAINMGPLTAEVVESRLREAVALWNRDLVANAPQALQQLAQLEVRAMSLETGSESSIRNIQERRAELMGKTLTEASKPLPTGANEVAARAARTAAINAVQEHLSTVNSPAESVEITRRLTQAREVVTPATSTPEVTASRAVENSLRTQLAERLSNPNRGALGATYDNVRIGNLHFVFEGGNIFACPVERAGNPAWHITVTEGNTVNVHGTVPENLRETLATEVATKLADLSDRRALAAPESRLHTFLGVAQNEVQAVRRQATPAPTTTTPAVPPSGPLRTIGSAVEQRTGSTPQALERQLREAIARGIAEHHSATHPLYQLTDAQCEHLRLSPAEREAMRAAIAEHNTRTGPNHVPIHPISHLPPEHQAAAARANLGHYVLRFFSKPKAK